MQLVTIGDSISQGFMSASAARTDLSFSTLLARCLGLQIGRDYQFPRWEVGGHPVNLELLLRRLQEYFGSDIFGPIEWSGTLITVMNFFNKVEDYYERGGGALDRPHPAFDETLGAAPQPFFHNMSVRSFKVSDAWQMTPAVAKSQIGRGGGDNLFGLPDHSFDRTACAVLNPTRDPQWDGLSALDWLQRHASGDSGDQAGVANLILWLGANNALGTILGLRINSTATVQDYAQLDQVARRDFNLWAPEHFEADYRILMEKVVAAMATNRNPDWRVFVGTVPAVTIAPLAKGVGNEKVLPDPFEVLTDGATYFQYYTYVPLDLKAAQSGEALRLEMEEAYLIDQTIHRYNQTIRELVDQTNAALGKDRFFIVDINASLLKLAFKRNRGRPTHPLPKPIDDLMPRPNTRYYDVTHNGQRIAGGLFSLDGMHPSAMGQGLLAHDFRQVMAQAGVAFQRELDWPAIIASDDLHQNPISLIREIYENTRLWQILLSIIRG